MISWSFFELITVYLSILYHPTDLFISLFLIEVTYLRRKGTGVAQNDIYLVYLVPHRHGLAVLGTSAA